MTSKIKRAITRIEQIRKKSQEELEDAVSEEADKCLDDILKCIFENVQRPCETTPTYVRLLETFNLHFFLYYDSQSYITSVNTQRVKGFAKAKGWELPDEKLSETK